MNSPTLTARDTREGVIIGTAAYMSPEQARGRPADRRADIWAFGVVLYEMLTGTRTFDGETVTDMLAAVVQREPDWSRLPSATPARIHRLLRRCLEKDPGRRLRDMGDARLEIADAIERTPDFGAAPALTPARTRSTRLGWWTAAVVAIALLTAGVRALLPASPARIVTTLDVTTASASDTGDFALSPDGREIVFAARAAGEIERLWLRSMDHTEARQLSDTDDATQPFWSPDMKAIGFFADGHLKKLDLATGAVQTLASAGVPRGGCWTLGDAIVYAPSSTMGLFKVPAGGGQPVAVTHLVPQQYSHRWPQCLADGRHILFSAFLGQSDTRGLFIASLDGGEAKRLLDAAEIGNIAPVYASGILLTVRQSVLFARRFDPEHPERIGKPQAIADSVGSDNAKFRPTLSPSDNGVLAYRTANVERRQLVWMDRAGRVLSTVGPPDDTGLAYPALAPDRRHAAVNRALDGTSNIWLVDLSRGTFSRLTYGTSNEISPVWSPKGDSLAFRSARLGNYDLFLKPLTGADAEETAIVVDNRSSKAPLDWSPVDDTLLYVSQSQETGADIWAVPMTGERKPYPVLHSQYDEMDAHFSPDGHWIIYNSNESGRFEVYVRGFRDAGPSQMVSTAGGRYPHWNPNGKELFYISFGGHMMSVPITMSADHKSLTPGTPVDLFPVRLATGSFITTASVISRAQYDVAADGRFLVNVAVEGYTPPPISIVLNWDALLKK
jgi:Tol biopolymer transport system component